MITEPTVTFPQWKPWSTRDNTAEVDIFDPPKNFDIGGIYLLAHFPAPLDSLTEDGFSRHLNNNVIYIGMSTRITARLEGKMHETVQNQYREQFHDENCMHLYYSIWYSEWTTWHGRSSQKGKVREAFLYYIERKLIWEYAKTFGRLPILNKK